MRVNFKVREVVIEDYDMLCRWWESWGWKPVPAKYLPFGYIVEDEHGPLYSCFVYLTGTGICWLEWLVSNKEASPQRKRGAKEFLVEEIVNMLRATSVDAIFTTSRDLGLVNGLKKCGFNISETDMVQLIKKID